MTDDPRTWRTIFMGTPELALPTLHVLAQRTALQQVITQPDRPAGRGRSVQPPPVKVAAEALGLPLWQPASLRDSDGAFLADIDLVVVLAYGELLREPVLAAPRLGCMNLHASLLPRWRGASPLQAAIRAGDAETGVCVMRMVRGLDAGPVYHRRRFALPARATLPWLHDRMAEEAALALGDYLDGQWQAVAEDQDISLVTRCGKLSSADGRIDWASGMAAVDAQVRAYEPQPGCWAPLSDGSRLRIRALRPLADCILPPGEVRWLGEALAVGSGDGALALEQVQPPGKRPMDPRSYCNGRGLPDFTVAE